MRSVRKGVRRACLVLAATVLVALPAAAQLQVGDNLHMNLNGNLGYDYSGTLDQGQSSHGTGFTGNANLAGSYYNANFLNFNISPFYNRTQSDSIYGDLTNTTGVGAGLDLFNGSHFPGSVSYNRLYNGTSEFGVPGSDIGLANHTNTQNFAIGWSALIPNKPTLIASYSINNTDSNIVGEEGNNNATDKTLMLFSNYKIDGWRLTGQFLHRNNDATLADLTNAEGGDTHSNSTVNTFTTTAQHYLPWTGSFSANYLHQGYSDQYEDVQATGNTDSGSSSGASNSLNANANFHPTEKFGVSFNASYNDNLLGDIPQSVLDTGTPLDMKSLGSFNSVLVGSDAYYQLLSNLGLHANISHTYQTFLGESYSATQFTGSANYNFEHSLLRGLTFSFSLVDTAEQESNTGLGFVGILNYYRKFSGWEVSGNFSYSQNVATALLVYTSSSYNYLGSIKRRFSDRAQWLLGYSGARTGITNSGATSSAQRAFTGLFYRSYNLNAFYDKSNGEAIFTASGLVPVTVTLPTQVLNGSEFSNYKSSGWGFGGGAEPVRRLIVSASYSKGNGSTIDPLLSIYNNNTLINSMMLYQLRKVNLHAGYTRLMQNLGVTGATPVRLTSYYVGITRWFNFF